MNLQLDIQSAKDIKQIETKYILYDIFPIPENIVSFLVGEPGTGKTFLVIQLAIRFVLENPTKKVLLCLSEDNKGKNKARLDNVLNLLIQSTSKKDKKKIQDLIGTNIDMMSNPIEFVNNGKVVNQVPQEFKKYSLIAFDPLASYFGGNEDKKDDASTFIRYLLMPFCNQNKTNFIILHHPGKEEGNYIRGSSDFIGSARQIIELVDAKKYPKIEKNLTHKYFKTLDDILVIYRKENDNADIDNVSTKIQIKPNVFYTDNIDEEEVITIEKQVENIKETLKQVDEAKNRPIFAVVNKHKKDEFGQHKEAVENWDEF
jgi:RecA-family ATPase